MKRIRKSLKWIKTAAGKISICLCLVSIVLLIIACSLWGNFSERAANNINNILFGIATNLLGIIVTVSFVQYFIDKQDEQRERAEERNMILKHDKVMSLFLTKYKKFHNCVVTPIEQRRCIDALQLKQEFSFKDMKDMYKESLYLSDGLFEPSIMLFYKSENDLRNYMVRMLENIQFKYNEGLYEILIEFTELSQSIDVRGSLLDDSLIKKLDEKLLKMLEEAIKNEEEYNWVTRTKEGKLDSNLMLPYVHFYWMLQKEADLLIRYETYIAELSK